MATGVETTNKWKKKMKSIWKKSKCEGKTRRFPRQCVFFFFIFSTCCLLLLLLLPPILLIFFTTIIFSPFFSFGCAHLRKRGSVATPLRASTRNGVSNELILLGFTESDRVLSSSATFQIGFSLKAWNNFYKLTKFTVPLLSFLWHNSGVTEFSS